MRARNPLDQLLLAMDFAARRAAAPPGRIQLHCEFGGHIDTPRVFSAIDAAARRCGLRALEPPGARAGCLEVADADAAQAAAEALLQQPAGPSEYVGAQTLVLRQAACDTLVVQWPHTLMDARGGVTLLEQASAGLENAGAAEGQRPQANPLCERLASLGMRAALRRSAAPAGQAGRSIHVPLNPVAPAACRVRYLVRRLDRALAGAVRLSAARWAGPARLADFIRAAALQALQEQLAHSPEMRQPLGDCYTTMNLLDLRRKRHGDVVMGNHFLALPLCIAAEDVPHLPRVLRAFEDQMRETLAPPALESRLARLKLLGRVPARLLGWWIALARRLPVAPLGVGTAPSLPLGFMGPLSREGPTLFGTALDNIFGLRSVTPQSGFALHANLAQGRLNLVGIYCAPRLPPAWVAGLLERWEQRLLAPAGVTHTPASASR